MKSRIIVAVCGLVIVAGVSITAQGGRVSIYQPTPPRIKLAEVWRPQGVTGDTKIMGTVIDIRQVPVANVRLQLRNLVAGTIEQEATANENGEYLFELAEPGSYVVEMITVDGYVVALSNAGALGRFETMNTVIQLPGRWMAQSQSVVMSQNVANFVGMSAQMTMTANTIQMAIDQNIGTVDSGEPVSP